MGGGAYVLVGRPRLAEREAQGLKTHEVNGLIPYLIQRVRQYPQDSRAWTYLGQAYMEERDPQKSFAPLIDYVPFTAMQNVTGQPAINMPLHWNKQGLPIGVQFVGRQEPSCKALRHFQKLPVRVLQGDVDAHASRVRNHMVARPVAQTPKRGP